MNKIALYTLTLLQLIFIQKIDCQNFTKDIAKISFHVSLNQNNISSVYEWRQEVCTLGCRATGSKAKLTFNGGVSFEFPFSNGFYLQPGFFITSKRYKEVGFNATLLSFSNYFKFRELKYLSFPISVKKEIGPLKKSQFFIEAGGVIDFLREGNLNNFDQAFTNSLAPTAFSFLGGIGLSLKTDQFYSSNLILRYIGSISKYNSVFSIISPDKLQPYSISFIISISFDLKKHHKG